MTLTTTRSVSRLPVFTTVAPLPTSSQPVAQGRTAVGWSPARSGGADAAKLGAAWQALLDDEGRLPKGMKVSRPTFAKGSDAANRLSSLRAEEGLSPTEVFKNPADGSFVLRSQTYGEGDARVYVYDASGKERWKLNVHDDGFVAGQPAKPIVPFEKPKGPTDSLLGNASAIATVKAEIGTKPYLNKNWVQVPKTKLSETFTPKESRLLPEAVIAFSRKLYRQAGDSHSVHKQVVDGHPIYVVHDEAGWQAGPARNEQLSKQVAWVFDASGNLLASGTRTISNLTQHRIRSSREAIGAYTWDATPRLERQTPWR